MSRANVVIGRTIHTKGYVRILMPDHPRASQTGYVFEHILVAERALGRTLPAKHPVHHHDENRQRNVGGNLVICEDNAYHKLLHRRMKALAACGNPNARCCVICGKHDRQGDITVARNDRAYHRSCATAYQRSRRV